MTTLSISLPEALKEFVEEQVSKGGYGTPSEYLGSLIREARARSLGQEIDAKLVEALESGPAAPMTHEDWEGLKRRVWERHASSPGR